jgi:mxaA protein
MALLWSLILVTGGASAAEWQVSTVEPRAYGHTVGDVIARRVSIDVPSGYTLDESTLPPVGRHGVAIELRQLSRSQRSASTGSVLELVLTYQVFYSPREVRTLELPPLTLTFKGTLRPQDVRVESWPLTVSPLVPVDVSPRRGLGELQPDVPPPLVDVSGTRLRLIAYAALAAALVAYLAFVYFGLPWWSSQRRPFKQAWRSLKAMPSLSRAPSSDDRRAAFQRVHEALNQTAGEVIFEQSIDRFIGRHPRFADMRDDLRSFFKKSREEFFASSPEGSAADVSVGAWLSEFCRKCRDIERGTA